MCGQMRGASTGRILLNDSEQNHVLTGFWGGEMEEHSVYVLLKQAQGHSGWRQRGVEARAVFRMGSGESFRVGHG